MRGAIAFMTGILGVVLVLAGAATLWAPAMRRADEPEAVRSAPPSTLERGIAVASRLPGGERLIGWGVVLLALAAVASGAISFSATASAGTD